MLNSRRSWAPKRGNLSRYSWQSAPRELLTQKDLTHNHVYGRLVVGAHSRMAIQVASAGRGCPIPIAGAGRPGFHKEFKHLGSVRSSCLNKPFAAHDELLTRRVR